MPANQIIKGLYIGDLNDARAAIGKVDVMVCVLERLTYQPIEGELVIPIAKMSTHDWMLASVSKLDKVAALIHKTLRAGKTIMVHCEAGMERSPLAVMWYLYRYRHMSLEEAYKFVKARRRQTQWCLDWLPNYHPSLKYA